MRKSVLSTVKSKLNKSHSGLGSSIQLLRAINHFPLFLCIGAILLFFLTNCANPIPPTGGPKDTKAPQLDVLNSTKNRQVRFEKQDIILAFNEWVELKEAFKQVVVSPPLEFRPTISRKKKTIEFQFDEREVLRDSATYVINFGEAIKDLTEGNVAPMVFVFSTGDYIDSLSVKGTIADAYTGEPVEEVLFMLYENLADSVFKTDRPFYFAKTDKSGSFLVENMKAGTFKAVALLDENLNYRFDNDAEQIAFLDTFLVVGALGTSVRDTLSAGVDSLLTDSLVVDSVGLPAAAPGGGVPQVSLRLFEEEKALFLRDEEMDQYGLVKLAFNRNPYDAVLSYDSIGQLSAKEMVMDSIFFWYAMEDDVAFNLYVQRDTVRDTIVVENGLKSAFYEKASLIPEKERGGRIAVISLADDYECMMNHPVFSVDSELVQLYEDSLKTPVEGGFKIDSVNQRKLLVRAEWKEGMKYEAEWLPGSLLDIYGLQNKDTIRRSWKMGLNNEYGSLTFRVLGLQPDTAYVIRLLANNDDLIQTYVVKDTNQYEAKLTYLPPDTYSLEIVEDMDENGRWTSGDYDAKRQPERIQKATLEEVRANWEVDAAVQFTGINTPQTAPAPGDGPPESTRGARSGGDNSSRGGRGRQ